MMDDDETPGFLDEDPRIGRVLAGKYAVRSLIGVGGMGSIYKGEQLELGEPVAIKFLHRMLVSTPELRARFKREAIALARVRHPAIVSLLDYGEDDGDLFMVMELVKGRTLAEILESGGASIPFIGVVFDQLLGALEVMHAEGLIHRDIKPSNVMVLSSQPEHIKLLDFGLVHLPARPALEGLDGSPAARKDVIEKLTQTGMAHGTPDYMSPEQCRGDAVDGATDIYALGVMLYECLAGKTPFDPGGAGQVMAQHLFLPPPPLPKERKVSPALSDLVMRALSKSAARRPTATEMRASLAEILHGTDPLTIADVASRERARVARLSRGERAITGRPPARDTAPRVESGRTGARVRVEISDPRRQNALRSALATARLADVTVLSVDDDDADHDVLILSAKDTTTFATLDAARAEERGGEPRAERVIIVVDVSSLEEMTECVRRGATDMMMAETADAELASRLVRLLSRRRIA